MNASRASLTCLAVARVALAAAVLLVVMTGGATPVLRAQDAPSADTSAAGTTVPADGATTVELATPGTQSATTSPADTLSAAEQLERKQRLKGAMAGLSATAAILIVGIALMVLIVLGAAYVRRLARQNIGPTAPRDEYWFLRQRGDALQPGAGSGAPDAGTQDSTDDGKPPGSTDAPSA